MRTNEIFQNVVSYLRSECTEMRVRGTCNVGDFELSNPISTTKEISDNVYEITNMCPEVEYIMVEKLESGNVKVMYRVEKKC